MGSFLEFIFSNSPIYFLQFFYYFAFLLDFFLRRVLKSSINGAADLFDNLPYFFDQAKKKEKKMEKINWRIGENEFEKRSHE